MQDRLKGGGLDRWFTPCIVQHSKTGSAMMLRHRVVHKERLEVIETVTEWVHVRLTTHTRDEPDPKVHLSRTLPG
jgi:hypothetical protein